MRQVSVGSAALLLAGPPTIASGPRHEKKIGAAVPDRTPRPPGRRAVLGAARSSRRAECGASIEGSHFITYN